MSLVCNLWINKCQRRRTWRVESVGEAIYGLCTFWIITICDCASFEDELHKIWRTNQKVDTVYPCVSRTKECKKKKSRYGRAKHYSIFYYEWTYECDDDIYLEMTSRRGINQSFLTVCYYSTHDIYMYRSWRNDWQMTDDSLGGPIFRLKSWTWLSSIYNRQRGLTILYSWYDINDVLIGPSFM